MPIPTITRLRSSDLASGERFNYTGMHRYILTLPVRNNAPVFNGQEITVQVLDSLRESCWHNHFDLFAYCFFPGRLMLIVRGREETSNLKAFLREFRAVSNTRLEPRLGHPLWAKKFLERVLRRNEDSLEVAQGFFRLVVKEGLAASEREYPLLGSFVLPTRRLFGPPQERAVRPSPRFRNKRKQNTRR
jgi:hypothetical protein